MKVSELFESSGKSVHSRVYRAVTDFALSRIKLDPETRTAAKYESENDRFWDSSVDEVTRTVERYIDRGSEQYLDYVFDAFLDCVENISEKVVRYYSNSMNHAPGYQKPKGLTYPSVEGIREAEMMKVLIDAVPEFKTAHDEATAARKAEEKAAKKARTAKAPEHLQSTADYLNKKWAAAFTNPSIRTMQRNPQQWADWFTADQIKAFKTPVDVEAAFKTVRDKIEWVLDAGRGFPKDYTMMAHIINTPALLKKLVPLLTNLK